jgi:hypothetical protein
MPVFIYIIVFLVGASLFHSNEKEAERPKTYLAPSYDSVNYYEPGRTSKIDRDEALDQYWDEIREYINGTETIEVYSFESGNFYTVDAEISNGEVESIYFDNGGYIYINALLNSDGTGEGYGADNYWEVEVDSYLIDNALEEWASDNGYEIW